MPFHHEILCSIHADAKQLLRIGDYIQNDQWCLISTYGLTEEGCIRLLPQFDHFIFVNPTSIVVYSTVAGNWFDRYLFTYPTAEFDVNAFFTFWKEMDPLSFRSSLELLAAADP